MFDNRTEKRLDRIERKLDRILALVEFGTAAEVETMATLDDVIAAVQAQTTVEQSVEALLAQLTTLLQEAQAAGDPAKIQQALDLINANTAALTAAVTANTPPA